MVVRLTESKKRTAFRYAAFVTALAVVAALQSPGMPDDGLKKLVYQNIASVIGVTAGVSSNQYSLLAQQLAQKDLEISSRERELMEREQALNEQYQSAIFRSQNGVFYAISGAALVLLLLILLNFYLDYVREKREEHVPHKAHLGELQTRL